MPRQRWQDCRLQGRLKGYDSCSRSGRNRSEIDLLHRQCLLIVRQRRRATQHYTNEATRDGVDGVAPRSLRHIGNSIGLIPNCRQRIGASSSGTLSSLSICRQCLPNCANSPHGARSAQLNDFRPHADPELLLSRLSFSHFAELII